jgi:hypothetical protein
MKWYNGELSKDVKEFLEEYNKKNDYGTGIDELLETLRECGKQVWQSPPDDHRWWYEVMIVREIDDRFIMYPDATSTRDMSAIESGWMMYLDCVSFVKPVEKTVIVYE